MMKRYAIVLNLLISSLFFLWGCGGGRTLTYVNPAANFSYIKKVAILPLNNMSEDKFAGEKIRNALTVELMSRQLFDVVEQGETKKALNVILPGRGVREGMVIEVDKELLKLIGEKLGVQAVIVGSVDEYSGRSYNQERIVSLSLRMLDTSSGLVLWQTKVTKSGRSMWRKLIGLDEVDTTDLSIDVVRMAIDTLL